MATVRRRMLIRHGTSTPSSKGTHEAPSLVWPPLWRRFNATASCAPFIRSTRNMDSINTPAIQQKNTARPLSPTGPRPSTAARSKVSENISKGKRREQSLSRSFHSHGTPILLSPLVMRSRGMGQCDLVRFLPASNHIEILEIKGSARPHVSIGQASRLRAAGEFVGKMLGASVILRWVSEA